jgi:hypothetical protein
MFRRNQKEKPAMFRRNQKVKPAMFRRNQTARYQPIEPGPPLNGPTTQLVIQPP